MTFTDGEVRDIARYTTGLMQGCVETVCNELLAARKRIAELEEMARAVAAFDKAGEAALAEDRG